MPIVIVPARFLFAAHRQHKGADKTMVERSGHSNCSNAAAAKLTTNSMSSMAECGGQGCGGWLPAKVRIHARGSAMSGTPT